jgi:MFS superfamily sulfate permease-like transporter
MSGGSSNEVSGILGSVASVGAGSILLPNTGGNSALSIIAISAIVLGAMVIASAVTKRIILRIGK